MARKTVAQKLREELALSMDMNRNAIDALKVVRAERDILRTEAEKLKKDTATIFAALNTAELQSQKKTQRLFQVIFDLHLKAAQHEGYIKRVTDLDGSRSQTTKVIDGEVGDGDVLRFREEIYGAESETQRDSILDSLDTETLDQVLGKAPQKDRFLRDE
jgi:hypothetical protein